MSSRVLLLLLVAGMAAAVIACSDSDPGGPLDGGEGTPVSFPIETQPTLSPDGQWVYYISTDTTSPDRSGIYRKNSADAQRALVLTGTDFSSPSVSPSGDSVAFIQNGQVWFYRPSDGRTLVSDPVIEASAVTYFDSETILLELPSKTLLLWSLTEEVDVLRFSGWNLNLTGHGYVVYLTTGGGDIVYIAWSSLGSGTEYILYETNTRSSQNTVQAPDFDFSRNYLLFTRNSGSGNGAVVIRRPGTQNPEDTVATAAASKAIFLPDGRIVYTGEDGRFWQTDATGSFHAPFTATSDPN